MTFSMLIRLSILKKIGLSLGLALSLLGIVLASLVAPTLEPKPIYAAGSRYVTNNCTGAPFPCYLTLQAAIDAAAQGDVIKVASGTYTGVNNYGGDSQIAFLSKTITLRGGYSPSFAEPANPDAYPTNLDAEGNGHVLYIRGNVSPIIEGLRITGGDTTGMPVTAGGGVYVITASVTLSRNVVFDNRATFGGGVFALNSQVRLFNNTIISNTVIEGGGGFSADTSSVILSNNTVISNTTDFWGGGLHFYESSARLDQNTIVSNTAQFGGGVFLQNSQASLDDNRLVDNEATYGGGIFTYFSTVGLTNNIINANSAGRGGAVYLFETSGGLTNTVMAHNQVSELGAALLGQGTTARLLHTTITGNSGGDGSGIHLDNSGLISSLLVLTNTILVSQTIGITVTADSQAILESTLWSGNGLDWSGTGTISSHNNYTGQPAFSPDGYHLESDSAAIDKGIETGVTFDIDGYSRVTGLPDLGADEVQRVLFLPAILKHE